MTEHDTSEARRLEQLWAGEFGDAYVERNREAARHRGPFWRALLQECPASRVLEVGCNLGANLAVVAQVDPALELWGIDVNEKALGLLRAEVPAVNAVRAPARELPFRDRWFDLVFTMGVLIHQPPEALTAVMTEIVRCSRRFVLCGEYFAPEPTEVPYRGQRGALFKRDYGALYQSLFPALRLRKQGFLGKETGWDDVTYWLLELP
jgi:pseudaminic acid biosynthesis-associated methylase